MSDVDERGECDNDDLTFEAFLIRATSRNCFCMISSSVVESSSVSCIFRHSAAHRGPQVPGKG